MTQSESNPKTMFLSRFGCHHRKLSLVQLSSKRAAHIESITCFRNLSSGRFPISSPRCFDYFKPQGLTQFCPSRHISTSNHTISKSDESPSIEELPLNGIIKVYATVSAPNFALPWQNKPLKEVTGSGFIISGNRILTNAHVVADQKFVMVRKHGSPDRVLAKVVAVGHDCDLALLTVDNSEFFQNTEPLQLSGVPKLEEEVTVVGYPTGGDNISVTRGVVSRVEPQQYAHGVTNLLAIQIDAAINPGNSGGPALQGNQVVGVAFQNLSGAENIGFVIPVPVISHFLDDVERNSSSAKPYSGFCTLGINCQAMENQQLRTFKQMSSDQTGVLVTKVQKVSPSHSHLFPGDVILSIDGNVVANDGSVIFRGRERIPFDWLLTHKHSGDTVDIQVLRNGAVLTVHVPFKPPVALVPVHQYDLSPSYYIFAGLVFTPLTQPYLHEWGEEWFTSSPRKLCDRAMFGDIEEADQQVVVLSTVLADAINVGYSDMSNQILGKINGVKVLNLAHVRELVESVEKGHVCFELEDHRLLVVDAELARAALPRLLENHRIPKAHSF